MPLSSLFFFFNDTATTEIYTLSLHDALPIALLSSALDRLAPGGRLVYSTCSLEPEENEQVVAEVLQGRRDIQRASGVGMAALKHLAPGVNPNELFDGEENFRTFPPEHQTDG